MKKKKIIVIAGPTASGKTALALRVAKYFNTQIISADSRQCYTELNIGVAKPTAAELAEVKHFFINSHSIQDTVTAASFERYALNVLQEEVFPENDIAVMVGGTGLYIKAFCEGLDEIPEVDPSLRKQITEEYAEKGLTWLQHAVQTEDPLYWEKGETQNPQRLMRALEVVRETARSIISFQSASKATRDFDIVKLALDVSREDLYRNINHRTDLMIRDGLVFEVRELLPYRNLNALQTVGYTEIFDHIDGKISLEEATEEIKKNTRHYAKRQLTWFRRDAEMHWVNPAMEIGEIDKLVNSEQ